MIRQFVLNTLPPILFFLRSLFLLCFVIFCDLCQAGYEMFYKLFFFLFYNGYALCCVGKERGGGEGDR